MSTIEAPTIRSTLRDAEAELAADVLEALRDAAKTIKTAWGTCTNCKHRVQVEIQDAQAAIAASKALLDYTGGKPGTADGQQDTGLTITRTVYGETAALAGRSEGIAHTPAGQQDGLAVTEQLWPRPDPDA